MLYYLAAFVILVLLRMAYKLTKMMSVVWKLQSQGVRFGTWLPPIQDPIRLLNYNKQYPAEFFFTRMIKEGLEVQDMPSVAGFAIPGAPGVFISNPDFLKDIYVTYSAYLSKHSSEKKAGMPLLNATIVSQPSDNPEYTPMRKVL